MFYTRNVREFIRLNDEEFRKMVRKVCSNYQICSDDVIQDLYLKFFTQSTLSYFNPNYTYAPKISTYLWRVTVNTIQGILSKERMMERYRYGEDYVDAIYHNNDCDEEEEPLTKNLSRAVNPLSFNEVEAVCNEDNLNTNYMMTFCSNQISDEIDGINLDLDLFERYLSKRNKTYLLAKRSGRKTKDGLTLLQLFKLMRKGYTNREIAWKFGVTVSFITTMSHEIKAVMMEFGISWNTMRKVPV